MKYIPILLATALLTVGCESLNRQDDNSDEHISYIIDGSSYYGNISNELIYRMLDMAYSGHEVTFGSEDNSKNLQLGRHETYTFSTSNRETAFRWAKRMSHNGFTITVTYNKMTSKYHCVARK